MPGAQGPGFFDLRCEGRRPNGSRPGLATWGRAWRPARSAPAWGWPVTTTPAIGVRGSGRARSPVGGRGRNRTPLAVAVVARGGQQTPAAGVHDSGRGGGRRAACTLPPSTSGVVGWPASGFGHPAAASGVLKQLEACRCGSTPSWLGRRDFCCVRLVARAGAGCECLVFGPPPPQVRRVLWLGRRRPARVAGGRIWPVRLGGWPRGSGSPLAGSGACVPLLGGGVTSGRRSWLALRGRRLPVTVQRSDLTVMWPDSGPLV